MLHGLLQGINSAYSFKFSMMGFNPFLTSGFSEYCFLRGNKCGSLSLTTIGIAFCARPTDFPSVHTLWITFCSIKGKEREGSIFMKTEAWTVLSISSVQFSRSVMSDTLWPHELQHARPPCPSPTPGVHPKVYSSPKGVRETLAQSETHVKIAPNPSHNWQKHWTNTFWLFQTVRIWKWIGKKVGQGLQ